jgi:hypothetical protein
VVLAETLASRIDDPALPGYVLAKLCSSYAGVLQLLSQLLGPAPDDPFATLLRDLSRPGFPEAMDEAESRAG